MPGNQVLVSERNAVMETYLLHYCTVLQTAKKSHGVSLTCSHKKFIHSVFQTA